MPHRCIHSALGLSTATADKIVAYLENNFFSEKCRWHEAVAMVRLAWVSAETFCGNQVITNNANERKCQNAKMPKCFLSHNPILTF